MKLKTKQVPSRGREPTEQTRRANVCREIPVPPIQTQRKIGMFSSFFLS